MMNKTIQSMKENVRKGNHIIVSSKLFPWGKNTLNSFLKEEKRKYIELNLIVISFVHPSFSDLIDNLNDEIDTLIITNGEYRKEFDDYTDFLNQATQKQIQLIFLTREKEQIENKPFWSFVQKENLSFNVLDDSECLKENFERNNIAYIDDDLNIVVPYLDKV